MAIMTSTDRLRYGVLDLTMFAQRPAGSSEVTRRLSESCFWSRARLSGPAVTFGDYALLYLGHNATSTEVRPISWLDADDDTATPADDIRPNPAGVHLLSQGDLEMLAHAAALPSADDAEDYSAFLLDDD